MKEREEFIKRRLKSNPMLTPSELAKELQERFGGRTEKYCIQARKHIYALPQNYNARKHCMSKMKVGKGHAL